MIKVKFPCQVARIYPSAEAGTQNGNWTIETLAKAKRKEAIHWNLIIWMLFLQGWLFWLVLCHDNFMQKDEGVQLLFSPFFSFFYFFFFIVIIQKTRNPTNKKLSCLHKESLGQMFSHLKKICKIKHMYVLWRQLLGDELHMQETSIQMCRKEAVEAPTKTYIFGHRDNCALYFLPHSKFFMNAFISLLISVFYL